MYQRWGKLLFLHWPVAAELLQPLLAPGLCLDTFKGRAWVSVTPFTMWGMRPIGANLLVAKRLSSLYAA
jgi:uncharacterized protein YqjF (DUF2071 family)